ncbi:uncharacterized protein THITE_111343 [Thermothielavioides terrestris NRRL 8126]|uniref:Uncharacterized protein n=1 Tax=Thermothielavioides terrestris (strain ATCC 38088 / NRRL 8126) TaxID=578455 RepID=G2R0H2_THETT|nr:uncharacterized protein THITE_111343 [Thermothielavioides terrestris NRRL 8126]AEO65637.1 hypothetical protein THITE_111343 [Thermothielavioides terrestris NRRL 8126]
MRGTSVLPRLRSGNPTHSDKYEKDHGEYVEEAERRIDAVPRRIGLAAPSSCSWPRRVAAGLRSELPRQKIKPAERAVLARPRICTCDCFLAFCFGAEVQRPSSNRRSLANSLIVTRLSSEEMVSTVWELPDQVTAQEGRTPSNSMFGNSGLVKNALHCDGESEGTRNPSFSIRNIPVGWNHCDPSKGPQIGAKKPGVQQNLEATDTVTTPEYAIGVSKETPSEWEFANEAIEILVLRTVYELAPLKWIATVVWCN